MTLSHRAANFTSTAMRSLQPARQTCPNCDGRGDVVARKYLVMTLRRCTRCQLQYRSPTDSSQESVDFYQEDYEEGATTAFPPPAELAALKAAGFPGMECNYSEYISALHALGVPVGARLFDFGCSWGYGSYQLSQAGFDVTSFEISQPRGTYARTNLGVTLVDDFEAHVAANRGQYDAFFSAHVLEHVPSPTKAIAAAFELLRPGGLFVSCFPNGCESRRKADPLSWLKSWGTVHPNLLDDRYLDHALAGHNGLLATSPMECVGETLDKARSGDGALARGDSLERYELFAVAIK